MLASEQVQWQRTEAAAVRVAGGRALTLRAALARPEDVGRGLIRLHPAALAQLGAAAGEVLAVERPRGVPAAAPVTTSAPRSGFGAPGDTGVALAQPSVSLTSSRIRKRETLTPALSQRERESGIAFARVVVDDGVPREAAAIDGLLRRSAGIGVGEALSLRVVAAAEALGVRVDGASAPLKSSELAALLVGVALGAGSFVQAGRGQLLRVLGSTPEGPAIVGASTLVQAEEAKPGFTDTGVWYEDVGGLDAELARVREIVELPLLRAELFQRLGVVPPKGVLLHGAPGTGKTLLARAVANECRATFLHINGPDLMHKFYGESEQRLKQLFEDAAAQAPSIIFIDEIDAVAPRRAEVLGEVEKRVVAQFLALMDGFVNRGQVVVIGATNLPQALDPALRRPGRFDREIEIGQPDRTSREQILRIHTRAMPLAAGVDLASLAERTQGFVGADLEALCQEAGMAAVRRLAGDPHPGPLPEGEGVITASDFVEAFHAVEPTAAREVLREQSLQTFADVGGCDELKRSLRAIFGRPGLARGVLLQGPSGVGKTLLARGLAGELGLPLIAVDGPLLYSKWLGESEKALSELFAKARHNAPCVLLLDQLEAIGDSRLEQMQRMVGQLLRELDDVAAFPEVAVIAATNRPELVDAAVKRRFDYVFDVPLPDEAAREAILRLHAGLSSSRLLHLSEGFTGAEIASAVRRARLLASGETQDMEECLCRSITR
jgi:transitional endoplasmic reticulum ATPase